MEPEVFLEKKNQIFFLHGFARYLTPNMALQTIILTSFFVFCFCFCFSSSSRSRAMRSSCHNFSKVLNNRNEIPQTCSGVNVVVPNTFWVHSGPGGSELGDLKLKKYFEIFPMLFQAEFQTSRFSRRYISTESKRQNGFRRAIAHWKAHCPGLVGKWVKLGFVRASWPWESQMLIFREINQHSDDEYNMMETFHNK